LSIRSSVLGFTPLYEKDAASKAEQAPGEPQQARDDHKTLHGGRSSGSTHNQGMSQPQD
jgi:hypothetical protein